MNMFDCVFSNFYKILKKAYERQQIEKIRRAPNVKLGNNVVFGPEAQVPVQKTKVDIGDNTWIYGVINSFPHNSECKIKIGKDCYIGDHSRIWVGINVTIGNRVLIAHNVNIFDTTTHPIDKKLRYEHECVLKKTGMPLVKYDTIKEKSIIIGDDVWIGCNALIMKGVTIGNGSIIAAGSVVVRDIPENTMVAGNPARVIKKLE